MYFYDCGFGIAGSDFIGASSVCFCNIEDTTIRSSEFRLYLRHVYRVIIHDRDQSTFPIQTILCIWNLTQTTKVYSFQVSRHYKPLYH